VRISEKECSIGVGEKDGIAIIATVDDVVDFSADINAWRSAHGGTLQRNDV
jgi:hypothetical protein